MNEPMDLEATLDALFTQLSKASGIPMEDLMSKLSSDPKFNRWRIKRVKHSSVDRYWIAAQPSTRKGSLFPQTMPDGSSGYDAARLYVVAQIANT